jgi:GNAT superfamily N-acetyltransferase
MHVIRRAESEKDIAQVRELVWEYLQWVNSRGREEYGEGTVLDIEAMLEQTVAEEGMFSPPDGRLLLAVEGTEAAGVAGLRRMRDEIGEIKRMYTRPSHRRRGIARALLDELIGEARSIGYRVLRLDTGEIMREALALYRSAGFQEIEPYPESEAPAEYHPIMVFMEKNIDP